MSFLKNGKRSVSAFLISYLTFSHSVCQNFFCDVNINVLDAFAKECSDSQESTEGAFSSGSKVQRSTGRSLKEVKNSKASSVGGKGLARGYLYLERDKSGKVKDAKSGFIYLSSQEFGNSAKVNSLDYEVGSGKTRSNLKDTGHSSRENVEDSSRENFEGDALTLKLGSNRSNTSSTDSRNVSLFGSKGVSRESKANGILRASDSKNTDTNRAGLLDVKVNKNKKRGDVSKKGERLLTDEVSSLDSTTDSGSVDLSEGIANKEKFIKETKKAKNEVFSADNLIDDMDSLFSGTEVERGLNRDIQVSGGDHLLDFSKTDSFSALKENTKVSTKNLDECLVLGKCEPSAEVNAVSLNSENNCSGVDCVKTVGNEVIVGDIADIKTEKSVFFFFFYDSKNTVKKVDSTLVSDESKNSLALKTVKNGEEKYVYKKCDGETCAPEQKNTDKDLLNVSEKSVGQGNILSSKNTQNEGSNSKVLVKKEFFNDETGKGEKVTVVSSINTETGKKDSAAASVLFSEKKVNMEDKDAKFLEGLVEEESWWSRWRKLVLGGIGTLFAAPGLAYAIKRYCSKDGGNKRAIFPYF